MILDTIQDPGNLGTILRAGEGAGITGVVMNDTTADIYNPKVIRSTMGSVCRVPFVYTAGLPETLAKIKNAVSAFTRPIYQAGIIMRKKIILLIQGF